MAGTAGRLRVSAVLTGVVVAALAATTPSAGAATPDIAATQDLAVLLESHRVVLDLDRPSRTAGRVPAFRPITGERTTLPVVDHTTTDDGVRWLRVLVPGRPNSRKGWIVERRTEPASTPWHLVVRTASRRVVVYRGGRRVKAFSAIVGKRSTPTPHGQFFVEESVRMRRGAAGAPYALALSARSNVFQEFEGGPGQIAIHGVQNIGGRPGTAVSHGCVRLSDRAISWVAARIPPGVPITIVA